VLNEIARGGMGAVLRAADCDIRREVAVKYLLDHADERKKARFVEEAQITGQLQHPNIRQSKKTAGIWPF
jgi:serine/threonine protein kinase